MDQNGKEEPDLRAAGNYLEAYCRVNETNDELWKRILRNISERFPQLRKPTYEESRRATMLYRELRDCERESIAHEKLMIRLEREGNNWWRNVDEMKEREYKLAFKYLEAELEKIARNLIQR